MVKNHTTFRRQMLPTLAALSLLTVATPSAIAAPAITKNTECVGWVRSQHPDGSLDKGVRASMIEQCRAERDALKGGRKKG